MTWPAAITLAIAVLGAALGVLNTWNSLNDRRVRLRVTPQWSIAAGFQGFAIEVANLSAFPVTVVEVGLTLGRPRGPLPRRMPISASAVVHGPVLPVRLDRREAFSVTFALDDLSVTSEITKAFARTADGTIRYGVTGALKQLAREGGIGSPFPIEQRSRL